MSEAKTFKDGHTESETLVKPNEFCSSCVKFWKSARCLRKSFRNLQALHSGSLGKDNMAYQGPSEREPDYCELYRSELYENEQAMYRGRESGCHSCALISYYFSQDRFRFQNGQITAGYYSGTIVASIVLVRDTTETGSIVHDLRLVCCEAVNNIEAPYTGDRMGVRDSDLSILDIREPDTPPDLPDDHSCWSTTTDSDRCCALISFWLNNCLKSCPTACSQNWSATLLDTLTGRIQATNSTTYRELPTRLLDLGALPDSDVIRLIKSETLQTVEYLTLSYTWGGVEPFKLLQGNLTACYRQIEVRILPKVCQQAIAMTRKLSFQYLWIDALCIIQDDKKDWLHESERMDSIFAGSTMTLAASATKNCTQELCSTRNPLETFQASLEGLGIKYRITPGVCSAPYLNPPPLAVQSVLGRGLDSRGWVYQERALSPRTVHFSGTRLHWECRSRWICEGRGSQCKLVDDGNAKTSVSAFMKTLATEAQSPPKSDRDRSQLHEIWASICSKYASTALTNWSDRQIAFAGLLRFLRSEATLTIFHGFCLDFGIRDLLWFSLHAGQTKRVSKVPTWSWQSLVPARLGIYNVHVRHLFAPRYRALYPETMVSQPAKHIRELATFSVPSHEHPNTLRLRVPMIGLTQLLKGGVKKSATQWHVWEGSQIAMIIHFLTEAGFTATEDTSRAHMVEAQCGVLLEGTTNHGRLVRHCLLVRTSHSSTSQYERVGVAEIEYVYAVPSTWTQQEIELV